MRSWLASGAASAGEHCISRSRGMLMKYLPAELFNAFRFSIMKVMNVALKMHGSPNHFRFGFAHILG